MIQQMLPSTVNKSYCHVQQCPVCNLSVQLKLLYSFQKLFGQALYWNWLIFFGASWCTTGLASDADIHSGHANWM